MSMLKRSFNAIEDALTIQVKLNRPRHSRESGSALQQPQAGQSSYLKPLKDQDTGSLLDQTFVCWKPQG
jgi:hypothetical protein